MSVLSCINGAANCAGAYGEKKERLFFTDLPEVENAQQHERRKTGVAEAQNSIFVLPSCHNEQSWHQQHESSKLDEADIRNVA